MLSSAGAGSERQTGSKKRFYFAKNKPRLKFGNMTYNNCRSGLKLSALMSKNFSSKPHVLDLLAFVQMERLLSSFVLLGDIQARDL